MTQYHGVASCLTENSPKTNLIKQMHMLIMAGSTLAKFVDARMLWVFELDSKANECENTSKVKDCLYMDTM